MQMLIGGPRSSVLRMRAVGAVGAEGAGVSQK